MRWNVITSRDGQIATETRLSSKRASQTPSSFPPRSLGRRRGRASSGRELIPLTSYRLDELVAELRPQPTDAHADDVGTRLEFITPYRRQELSLRDRLA